MTSNLDVHLNALATNPANVSAFEALEEAYFLAGDWEQLVDLYSERLSRAALKPRESATLLFRQGQVLDERCLDQERAVAAYTEAIRQDPSYRPALQQLRQIYAERDAWDLVLQVAEVEIAAPMQPYEQAAFFAEMGTVWLTRIRDTTEAMSCFEQALGIDPVQQDALAGLARTLEAQGRPEQAAATWERLIGCIRGPDRAAPLVALAMLLSGPLQQPERAIECHRRALGDDPKNADAVEALVVAASAGQQWPLLADLYERRFGLTAGARRRTAIALEVGHLQLERLANPGAARMWFERAQELATDDVSVFYSFAELARKEGDDDALLSALERLTECAGEASPLSVWLELANLYTDRNDDERASVVLERAHQRNPSDPLVLEALSETLSSLGRYSEVADLLLRRAALAEDDPESRASALMELGRVRASQLGDTEAALEAYEEAFEVLPSLPGAAATLERLYRKQERFSELQSLLERAAELGPVEEIESCYCSLGELLLDRMADPAAAAVAFEAALDRGQNPRALAGLERIARDSGDEDALLRALERGAEATSNPDRQGELARELTALFDARGQREDALRWAERMLGVAPEDREALSTVARLQEALGHEDELARTLGRLDDLLDGTEQAGVRRRLAKLHEQRGMEDDAIRYWEAALESDPDDLDSLAALRGHYASRGRAEDLAPILRKLSTALPEPEQVDCLDALAGLLEEQLCDLNGAIVVLFRLKGIRGRPADVEDRLESLLERAGRFEELAQQLLERRRSLPDESTDAINLDLRRAQLLLDALGQFEEAVEAFRFVRFRVPDSVEARKGLERALRAANDSSGLARLLAELVAQEDDPARRADLEFERAVLLEEPLGEIEQARQAYTALAEASPQSDVGRQAGHRLEGLLERTGNWPALRDRLEAAIERASGEQLVAIHERLATLCRDRMDDPEGCARHLEASGRASPHRPDPWRKLASLYRDLDRPDDLLRVTEAELQTGPDAQREGVLHALAGRMYADRPNDESRAREHYQRLLELEPGRADATEFLVARYEPENRYREIVQLLETRLVSLSQPGGAEEDRGLRCALRIRISMIRAEELDDLSGAIDVIEPALAEGGPDGPAAAPLADLYRLAGRTADLASLCGNAGRAATGTAEKALWQLRLADALRDAGQDEDAAAAYREVLAGRPDDREAVASLCDLYRNTNQLGPLSELLEGKLTRASRSEEIDLRMELARLLEESLNRPDEAFSHLKRIIELESDHGAAFQHALQLAARQGSHDEALRLLDTRLEGRLPAKQRAGLLEQRADLLAGPIDATENAIATYREVIALDPTRNTARRSLREVLERLGRWTAVLDCLYVDAESADSNERVVILERAVELATANVGPDAALPWLERVRAERPNDALIIARIADVHRLAGRFESVLRAIEDELAITSDPQHERDLHVARARILERDMQAPGRAIAALEAARAVLPGELDVLCKLDELYAEIGRARDRVAVVEERIEISNEEQTLALHRTAARLLSEDLSSPERAIPHLLHATALTRTVTSDLGEPGTPPLAERMNLLSELVGTLRLAGWVDGAARALEAQLELLTKADPTESTCPEPGLGSSTPRRADLHQELARIYLDELADDGAATRHIRALLDVRASGTEIDVSSDELDRLECELICVLRRESSWVELEQRLSDRVYRHASDASAWLELARLRDERLQSPKAALVAYRAAIEQQPTGLPAIRGLRDVGELLGDWSEVARSLELELAADEQRPAHERAALLRRQGEVCWHRLDALDRATAAYTRALTADPHDLTSLRALQQLHETREQWSAALDACEREVDVLADGEPERRRHVWLQVAALARDRSGEPGRALRAYEAASEIEPLAATELADQADLYRLAGARARYVEVFASWCDHPNTRAASADHLTLARALIDLGRKDEALSRTIRACDLDPTCADAWELTAELYLDRGDQGEAALALERAGESRRGSEGAARLAQAGLLVESTDASLAIRRLRRAVAFDAGSSTAHGHLARLALAQEAFQEAETAAGRCLDLASAPTSAAASETLQLEAALAGGAASRSLGRLDAAALFFASALGLEPNHAGALEAQAEVLFERGDLRAAQAVLEKRFELGGEGLEHGRRLSMLGSILELSAENDAALAAFRDAVEADSTNGQAHAGIARLCERAGRSEEAVVALDRWAEIARDNGDAASCAAHLLHAAELELNHDRIPAAEMHLRRSLAASPTNARAWVLLTEIAWDAERVDEVLRLAPDALCHDEVSGVDDVVARLSLLYGRALERSGAPADACNAYAEALSHDARSAEAALAHARLLRAAGEWREAALVLETFCDRHPESDHRDLAQAQYKLARLLAGPLEDMDGALRCYERALEIAPDHLRARAPLASLLTHMPERWTEAVRHHAALLNEDPTCAASIRSVKQIADQRKHEPCAATGLALLRALGTASPTERTAAPAQLPQPIAIATSLDEPLWETARLVLQLAREALEQVLDGDSRERDPQDWESASFSVRLDEAAALLGAPGIDHLDSDELADLLFTLAALAVGEESDAATTGIGKGRFAGSLDRTLGRWTRRKIRKTLEGTTPESLRDIDFDAWRVGLRALAAATVVDRSEGDLRTALIALCPEDGAARDACEDSEAEDRAAGLTAAEIQDHDDLSARIGKSPIACELLRMIETRWCTELAGS